MPYKVARNGLPFSDAMDLEATMAWVRKVTQGPGPRYAIEGKPYRLRRAFLNTLEKHLHGTKAGEVTDFAARVGKDSPEVTFRIRKVAPVAPPGTSPSRYGPYYPTTGPCTDPPNLVTFRSLAGDTVTLQQPAVTAFKAAEAKYGKFRITGSIRSCATQTALYKKDPARYADPAKTRHTRGLAIDVHTGDLTPRLIVVLADVGWNRSRPTDEPWHHSAFETG